MSKKIRIIHTSNGAYVNLSDIIMMLIKVMTVYPSFTVRVIIEELFNARKDK